MGEKGAAGPARLRGEARASAVIRATDSLLKRFSDRYRSKPSAPEA